LDSVIWDDRRPVALDHAGPADRLFDPIDEAWRARSLLDRFEYICDRFPDRIAIDDGVTTLSYRELRNRAYGLAAELAERAPADKPVAAVIYGNAVYPVALVACLAQGLTLSPIDITHPHPRKSAILEETAPGFVLVAAGGVPEPGLIPDHLPRLAIDLSTPAPEAPRPPTPPGSALSGIAFTSGSTGRPKGLAYSQATTLAFVAEYVNSLHINEDDVIIALASLGAGGNMSVLAAILTGAKVRMLDIKTAGIDGTLKVMADDKITILSMIPLVFRTLFAQPGAKEAVRYLRAITSGGDRLLGADIKLFRSVLPDGCHIRATQGATETTVVFSWFIPEDVHFEDQATVPSGYLNDDKSIGMLAVEPGEHGVVEAEFLVRGANLSAGSWQSGRLTPGPFVIDPEDPTQKIFDTGDVVRKMPSGLYEFIGRRDRMIKILGLRADPSDVEAILRKEPGVGDVVVIPRRNGDEAVFIAYVAPVDLHALPSAEALQTAVGVEAPPHLVPAEVKFLPSIPRLPNYKPDFVALQALDKASQPVHSPEREIPMEARRDSIAGAVGAVWSLTVGEVSLREGRPWNRSGGDSLKALQLMLRIEERIGRKLPLDLFDPALDANGLAEKITAFMGAAAPAPASRPSVVLFPGAGGDEPILASLRLTLRDEVQFELIEYMGLEHKVSELLQSERVLDDAMKQLEARCPTGPLRLVGYSLGGVIAYEMAKRMTAKGRTVESVCLLDTSASPRDQTIIVPPKESLLQKARWVFRNARATGWGSALQELALNVLLRHKAFRLMRWMIMLKAERSGLRSVYAYTLLLKVLQGYAFQNWAPSSYPGEVWLLRATERRNPADSKDLDWTPHVGKLKVVNVPGSHHSMLIGDNLETVASLILESAGLERGAAKTLARTPA